MSKLLIKPNKSSTRRTHITPQNAGWTYVGFDLHEVEVGAEISGHETARETCLVFISGKARIMVDGVDLGIVGNRMSPFEGKPWSVYVPPGATWEATAATSLTLAVCTSPAKGGLPTRIISPEGTDVIVRGKGSNVRHVMNILAETDVAESLLVVEVITPAGNTSSYPPHKHDQDNLPHESFLEETYYHRLNPPQGFAFQRVYTDDRSLDEAMAVEDGDVTLVPKGYHPCATVHGYDLYYLNVMAGPKRTWKFHNAEEHEWLLKL